VTVELSLRYGVIGLYKDRNLPLWHLYPCPFVRVTLLRRVR
jgi:hypothetical protein